MKLYTLEKDNPGFEQFVNFWKQFYSNDDESFYQKHINKKKLKPEDLDEFSKFRNKTENLNQDKQAIFPEVKNKIEILNGFKKQEKFNLKKFKEEFDFVMPLWLFYLLHWCKPHVFPIFDKYTFKAQRFIQFEKIEDLPFHHKTIEKFYFNHYIPDFYQKIPKEDSDDLDIYKALYSFGEFLENLTCK